jgi:RNA polymerase sigma-70 factor (ECF subfamily)
MSEPGDRALPALATDPAAFEAFYREHLPVVRLYLARRIDDPSLVADLTADIFVQVINSAASYRSDLGPPRAWLIGIARHVVSGHRRARSREHAAMQRLAGRRLLDEDSAQRILNRIAAERDMSRLLTALEDLPAKLRAVVELVAIDDLSITEAAQVLGIKPGTARVRYHRARNKLRTELSLQLSEVAS